MEHFFKNRVKKMFMPKGQARELGLLVKGV